MIKTGQKKIKLNDNYMLRIVVQNNDLPNAISTNFLKVKDFKLSDLEKIINISECPALEYRD